jgi:hypothetical protein
VPTRPRRDRTGHAFRTGIYVDGLADQTGYTVNELGHRTQFALPPRPGGPTGIYAVAHLAAGNQPAEMTYIGSNQPNNRQRRMTTASNGLFLSEETSRYLILVTGLCRLLDVVGRSGVGGLVCTFAANLRPWSIFRRVTMCVVRWRSTSGASSPLVG